MAQPYADTVTPERLGARTSTDAQGGEWIVAERQCSTRLPLFLTGPLGRVRAQAGPDRLGVVILSEWGAHDGLVVLSTADFREWFGPLPGDQVDGDLAPDVEVC